VDSCVGYLATTLAATQGKSPDLFIAYANAHRGRVLAPYVTYFLRSAPGSIRWAGVPDAALSMKRLWSFARSPEFTAASRDEIETRIRTTFEAWFAPIAGMFTDDEKSRMIDILSAAGVENAVRERAM
jgi:hypothetical protein